MRILVTGSNGFIGKHVVEKLKDEHEVVPYDIGRTLVRGPFDGIIHLAAVSNVRDADKDPVAALHTNIILTAMMLDRKPKWFIYAGTSEKPTNVYGLSKRAAEDYVKLKAEKYVIFRLTNVHGKGMREDKLLPRLARNETVQLHDKVLPFEHIPVSVVAEMIRLAVAKFDDPDFRSYTMKLATGIARTEQELRDVAASY